MKGTDETRNCNRNVYKAIAQQSSWAEEVERERDRESEWDPQPCDGLPYV